MPAEIKQKPDYFPDAYFTTAIGDVKAYVPVDANGNVLTGGGGGGGSGVADTVWIDTGNANTVFVYRDTGTGSFTAVTIPAGAAYTVVGPIVPAAGRLSAGTDSIGSVGLLAGTNSIGSVGLLAGTNTIGTVNQVGARPWFLSLPITITRPANTIAYTVGGLVASATTGLAILPTVNLGIGNQRYTVTEASVFSSNGAAATRGQFSLYLFDVGNPAGITFNDNTPFNPTIVALASPNTCKLGLIPTSVPNSGTATYGSVLTNASVSGRTSGTGAVFIALVASNAYVPISGEIFNITLAGVY